MKLAVVIPWFGRDLKGGAEQHAWQIAKLLATRGHALDVLTTCCRSHQDDWETNHLPAGETVEPEGFTVHRFPVGARERAAFNRVCADLLSRPSAALKCGVPPVPPKESKIFVDELIKSQALLAYLAAERETYDWFIFLPYLYGPILHGIRIVGDRAALQPCLHDEAYAYLPEIADAFYTAGRLLFNSEGEQELALRLFGPGIAEKSHLVGGGVETASLSIPKESAPNGAASAGRYVLYLGRKDPGKNVPLLLRAFRRFRAQRPNSDLRLLLAGHGAIELEVQDAGAVEDLGVVEDGRKEELLHECAALFQPSQNESLSRVILEAWMHGKPVAAHRACLATAVAVERAEGGWIGDSEEEWAALFGEVHRSTPDALAKLGARGRRYAEELGDWNRVVERYERALQPTKRIAARGPQSTSARGTQINQFLPNLSFGDAISNYAIWIRNQLRTFGFRSEIYVRHLDPQLEHECAVFSPDALARSDAAIYHHSIGSEITPHLQNFAGPKCLIYHNITPAEFFEPYRPEFARILRQGRTDLAGLARYFDISYGDSSYNIRELEAVGFPQPSVIPVPVDPQKWNFAPDPQLMGELQDGRTNLLFVGRKAPNKKQDDLVTAFAHYLDFDPDARLIIVGKGETNDPYGEDLRSAIEALGLEDSVLLPGSVGDTQLAAYYRTAHLFWSMSEHEGFCVPLVEAMWFDLPVLAFRSTAVPETLEQAGIMFTEKTEMRQIAALAFLLVHDSALRIRVIGAQRERRRAFLPSSIAPRIEEIVRRLLAAPRPEREKISSSTNR